MQPLATITSIKPAARAGVVQVNGVGLVYKTSGQDVLAVSDVSLEVKPGRFVVLVGPSGCGKSSLLMMMAGLDGVMNRIDPGDPLDKDIYSLSPEELKDVPHMPGSLDESLEALEKDHEFLLRGDVFTRDLLTTWIDYKREREVDAVRLRPVPHEFYLYYDC